VTVTDIRSRQLVQVADADLLTVIGAALSAKVAYSADGQCEISPWDKENPSPLASIFDSMFAGRRFANLQSLASVVVDMQLEQLDMAQKDAARYRWLRSADRSSDAAVEDMGPAGTIGLVYVSSGNGSAAAVDGDALDRAIDSAIEADLHMTPDLPEGFRRIDGEVHAVCCCCEQWKPLPVGLDEIGDPENYQHHCGGSPRCCP